MRGKKRGFSRDAELGGNSAGKRDASEKREMCVWPYRM